MPGAPTANEGRLIPPPPSELPDVAVDADLDGGTLAMPDLDEGTVEMADVDAEATQALDLDDEDGDLDTVAMTQAEMQALAGELDMPASVRPAVPPSALPPPPADSRAEETAMLPGPPVIDPPPADDGVRPGTPPVPTPGDGDAATNGASDAAAALDELLHGADGERDGGDDEGARTPRAADGTLDFGVPDGVDNLDPADLVAAAAEAEAEGDEAGVDDDATADADADEAEAEADADAVEVEADAVEAEADAVDSDLDTDLDAEDTDVDSVLALDGDLTDDVATEIAAADVDADVVAADGDAADLAAADPVAPVPDAAALIPPPPAGAVPPPPPPAAYAGPGPATDAPGLVPPPPAPPVGPPAAPGAAPVPPPAAAVASHTGLDGIRTELLTDERYAEAPSDQRVSRQNGKLLKVVLGNDVMARQGSMVAYQGAIDFDYEGSGANRLIKKVVTGEGLPLMRCTGQGELFLADGARQVHIVYLEGAGLTINGRNILAFEPSLNWDIERISGAGIMANGLFNTKLEGHGWVAITTDGDPLVLRTDRPTVADADSAVAWSSSLSTSIVSNFKAKALVGRGTGELFQLAFSGDGVVIVQPSEGRSAPPSTS